MTTRSKPAMRARRGIDAPAQSAAAEIEAPGLALGDLPSFVGYALRRAQLAVFQDFVQTMAALDIRPAQFSVLLLIRENPGVKQTQISEALGIKSANFVVMLNELETRGLAKRRPGSADRRSHALYLTPAGEALMVRLDDLQLEHERRIEARLGADGKRRLLELLAQLTDDLPR